MQKEDADTIVSILLVIEMMTVTDHHFAIRKVCPMVTTSQLY